MVLIPGGTFGMGAEWEMAARGGLNSSTGNTGFRCAVDPPTDNPPRYAAQPSGPARISLVPNRADSR